MSAGARPTVDASSVPAWNRPVVGQEHAHRPASRVARIGGARQRPVCAGGKTRRSPRDSRRHRKAGGRRSASAGSRVLAPSRPSAIAAAQLSLERAQLSPRQVTPRVRASKPRRLTQRDELLAAIAAGNRASGPSVLRANASSTSSPRNVSLADHPLVRRVEMQPDAVAVVDHHAARQPPGFRTRWISLSESARIARVVNDPEALGLVHRLIRQGNRGFGFGHVDELHPLGAHSVERQPSTARGQRSFRNVDADEPSRAGV